MLTRLPTTRSRVRKRYGQRSAKKRSIRKIHRTLRHPCQRCSKIIRIGRYCYSCGHYRLGLF